MLLINPIMSALHCQNCTKQRNYISPYAVENHRWKKMPSAGRLWAECGQTQLTGSRSVWGRHAQQVAGTRGITLPPRRHLLTLVGLLSADTSLCNVRKCRVRDARLHRARRMHTHRPQVTSGSTLSCSWRLADHDRCSRRHCNSRACVRRAANSAPIRSANCTKSKTETVVDDDVTWEWDKKPRCHNIYITWTAYYVNSRLCGISRW